MGVQVGIFKFHFGISSIGLYKSYDAVKTRKMHESCDFDQADEAESENDVHVRHFLRSQPTCPPLARGGLQQPQFS